MNKLFVFIFLIASSIFSGAQTSSCWQNSRGNSALQGNTEFTFPQKFKLKWTYNAEGIFKSAPVVCNGKIVAGSTNGEMLCVDLTGKRVWSFKTDNSIEASAIIHDGVVYFGNLSGTLYAVDLNSGQKRWEYKTDNQIMGAPSYTEIGRKKMILTGSYDFFLHAVDASTGNLIWKYETENYLNSSPAISGGEAIFGGCDGFLHAVSLKDGKSDQKTEVATYIASSPAVIDNRAYVGDYDGGFSCIDLAQKKIVWHFQNNESTLPFIASPSVIGNRVIIGSRDKFLYCFDKTDGSVNWKTNTGSRVDASTVVNKSQVLVVNMRGDVLLLDIVTGKIISTYELGVGVINTPAVIDGTVVVAASDGNIYCLTRP